jgi:hypothetical protein
MTIRKGDLKFYAKDHRRVAGPDSPGVFYAVETVIHTSREESGVYTKTGRTVWLLSDPTIRADLPTMGAVRRWINSA